MRVTFQQSFVDGLNDVNHAAERVADAQRRVGSGRRLNAASDDPSGTAAAIREHGLLAEVDAYQQTSDAATSRLAVADSVLSDMVNQLTSAQTTASAARGSSRTQTQRDAYSGTILAIRDSLLNDINTRVGSTYLFSGTADTAPFAAQPGGGFTAYQGTSATQSVQVADGRTVQVSLDGSAIMQGADPANLLDALTSLADAIRLGYDAGIQTGLDAVNRGFSRVTTAQTGIGISQRVLDDMQPQRDASKLAAAARASKLEDADLAVAITDLTSATSAQQAALQALSSMNRLSLMDYLK